jgi:hypothetical protein
LLGIAAGIDNNDMVKITQLYADEALNFASLTCNASTVLSERRDTYNCQSSSIYTKVIWSSAWKTRSTPAKPIFPSLTAHNPALETDARAARLLSKHCAEPWASPWQAKR